MEPDDMMLKRMCTLFDVPLYEKKGSEHQFVIYEATRAAISYSIDHPETVDFDDMIFLPNILPVTPIIYRFIGVDELQDTNLAQRRLISLCSETDYTLTFGVGDPWQSIYNFRGAGATSFSDFKEEFSADEFPLSISYRAPRATAEYVNQEFPHIKFEIPENAKIGLRAEVSMDTAVDMLRPGDMVMCRVNADNVTLCLKLLRIGKKAVIRGKEIGQSLTTLVKQSKIEDIRLFPDFLEQWKQEEITKAIHLDSKTRAITVQERYDMMLAIMDGCKSMEELLSRCIKFFTKDDDEDTSNSILLSSIHKAKGLEAERIFIIRPDLLPHPAADTLVELQQEDNIRYVANTRSLNETYLVE